MSFEMISEDHEIISGVISEFISEIALPSFGKNLMYRDAK